MGKANLSSGRSVGDVEVNNTTTTDIRLVDSPTATSQSVDCETSAGWEYRVYKRRFFGLAQLVLLNIIVSWDWLSFSPVSKTASQYFAVSEGSINWLSTAFLFAFCVATPATIWTLNRRGPKAALVVTSSLILVGNWIRYAGTRATNGHFGVVMFGQIIIGLAQPFCLSAPTRYSDLWFSDKGRISATAVASLANPFGGALGQLIDPFLANTKSDIPNMVLYISIISTIAAIPSFFIPSHPPTPPSAASTANRLPTTSLLKTLASISGILPFWLIAIPFAVYVGLFNSISSLLNQMLEPYGYSETEAGIAGALLIVVGLVTAAIISPLCDRYKAYLLVVKTMVPTIGICYLVFYFAPSSGSIVASYVVCSCLGASCFGLVPVALEYLVEIMYPIGPEIGSTICWAGGQILGALFIIISDALKAGKNADPPRNMSRALIFQAVIGCLVIPLPLVLGLWGIEVRRKREEIDVGGARVSARRGDVVAVGDGTDDTTTATAATANNVDNEHSRDRGKDRAPTTAAGPSSNAIPQGGYRD